MVPHLATALTGPINELEQRLLDATPVIERWFRLEWMEHAPPMFCAIDLRNAGFKVAPVDTELFPRGWHNLALDTLPLAVQAAQGSVEKLCPEAHAIMLIPASGPQPPAYWASVARLQEIFGLTGLKVRIGSIDRAITEPTTVAVPGGEPLLLEPVQRTRYRLTLKHFDPAAILLNDDLAAGVPGILEDLHEQYLLPPLQAGWSVRRKSRHFRCYEDLCKQFGKLVGIDPWLINPLFATCGDVDVHAPSGGECLKSDVDALLTKIRRKYKEYGINEKPFVVVKADQGTSGMGIMTVHDVKELEGLAAHAAAGAERGDQMPRGEVIIQEGILTKETVDDAVAEPVVYLIDRYVVGGFYRVHAERAVDQNLKAPGARFEPLPFVADAHLPRRANGAEGGTPNRFYMYGVLARIAMVAASYELEATDPETLESAAL